MGRRARAVRTVVIERDEDEASTSEEEMDDEEEEDDEEQVNGDESEEEEVEEEEEEGKSGKKRVGGPKRASSREEVKANGKKGRLKLSLKGKADCKVCGGKDHTAGFVGSVYMDCPNRPCYLCKQPGHTTATCPHRIAPTSLSSSSSSSSSSLATGGKASAVPTLLQHRQLRGRLPRASLHRPVVPNEIETAVLALHMRRVNVLEFHPVRDDMLLSGDKRGHIGIWNFERDRDTTVHQDAHKYQISAMRFRDGANGASLLTSSLDGLVCDVDIDTGCATTLLDLNPQGWQGDDDKNWNSVYSMDVQRQGGHAIVAGDTFGNLHLLDARSPSSHREVRCAHKKGTKIVSVHCNPADSNLLATAGNDHEACLWDLRCLEADKKLRVFKHPRVVNSAFFSPLSGSALMTTCQDNRIRVWDNVFSPSPDPSRVIVHSHDFNRYLSPFKAVWDPKDEHERLAVCGRYISEDYEGVALHPIDFIDASTGAVAAAVVDRHLTTICPVNLPHPRLDILATGSSRSVYIWKVADNEVEEGLEGAQRANGSAAVAKGEGTMVRLFNVDRWSKKKKASKGGKTMNEDFDDEGEDEEEPKSKKKKPAPKKGKK